MGQSPTAAAHALCPGSVTWEAPVPCPPGPSVWSVGREPSLQLRALECRVEASGPASSLGHKGAGEPPHFLTTGGTPGLGAAGACIALQGAPGAGLGLGTQLLMWWWGGGGQLSSPTAQTLPVLRLLRERSEVGFWPSSLNQHGEDFSPTLGQARSNEDLERVLGFWDSGEPLEGGHRFAWSPQGVLCPQVSQ